MSYLLVCMAAAAASALTFFSGFGLGTLLLPVFALFVPVDQAVAFTAVVHFLNSVFKVVLVGRCADRSVVLRFGLPAIGAAIVGAWALQSLGHVQPLMRGEMLGRTVEVTPVKLAVGGLLLAFAVLEVTPLGRGMTFPARYMPLGGLLSGFCGGLSGLQGALRSAFLLRVGLSKEAFIATGVVIACLVDISRLGVYASSLAGSVSPQEGGLLGAAVAAAFMGTMLGNCFLRKATMATVQRIVAVMLVVVAIGMITGIM